MSTAKETIDFRPINCDISELIEDRYILTMED